MDVERTVQFGLVIQELDKKSNHVQETVSKTDQVFRALQFAGAFTSQKPANIVVANVALATAIGSCMILSGVLLALGPWSLIAKPIFQQAAVRTVIVSGNIFSNLIESKKSGKSFRNLTMQTVASSQNPFAVSVFSTFLGDLTGEAVKSVINPYGLGLLEVTAIKTMIRAPIKQVGAVAGIMGYNQIFGTDQDPMKALSIAKILNEPITKVGGEWIKRSCQETWDFDGFSLGCIQIGAILTINFFSAEMMESMVNRISDYLVQDSSQLRSEGKFADSKMSSYIPTVIRTCSPHLSA